MPYNTKNIVEITEFPDDFHPHKMLCWDHDPESPIEEYVLSIVKRSDDILFITDHSIWHHGAEIPDQETQQSRILTCWELARWCAEGHGQWTDNETKLFRSSFSYAIGDNDRRCNEHDNIMVRAFADPDSAEWHEPDVQYCFVKTPAMEKKQFSTRRTVQMQHIDSVDPSIPDAKQKSKQKPMYHRVPDAVGCQRFSHGELKMALNLIGDWIVADARRCGYNYGDVPPFYGIIDKTAQAIAKSIPLQYEELVKQLELIDSVITHGELHVYDKRTEEVLNHGIRIEDGKIVSVF